MVEPPFFSVIVPTHKRPRLLRRALDSIKSQDSPARVEAIVISDAIDPDTDKICSDLLEPTDIYIRRNGKAGPSQSRNFAISIASGKYILFLDDDDAWHPEFLRQLGNEAKIKEGRAVYFNCTVVKERRPSSGPEKISEVAMDFSGSLTKEIYVKNQIPICCFAFPNPLLKGLWFDTTMKAYEDWEFVLSVIERETPLHVPVYGSQIFEVDDETSDRRGNSREATDLNIVFDYLYTYRRHPAPTDELRQKRAMLMGGCGIPVPPEML